MPKKLFIIVVSIMMCLGILSGCNIRASNILATGLFSKNVLELPIKGILPNAPGYYYIDMNIEEIYLKISSDESLTVELVDGKIFIAKSNDDNTKDYFLIREMEYNEGNRIYQFFAMDMLLDLSMRMLMPYHLMTGDRDQDYSFMKSNYDYKTKYNVDDFFNYYNESGWYDVEKEDDYILINGYLDPEKVSSLNNALRYPISDLEFGAPTKIQFRSSDVPNVNIFVIS